MKKLCLGLALVLAHCCNYSTCESQDRYGGIEIGAKGIKSAAVEINAGKITELKLNKETVNVTLARIKDLKFDQVKVEDVAIIVNDLKQAMIKELSIPEINIRVVASSGVPTFATNRDALITAIRTQAGLNLEQIVAAEEAALTNLALIPTAARGNAMVIDIGSGNTKGGAFIKGTGSIEDFAPIDVKFGTATLAKRIDELAQESDKNHLLIAQDFTQQEVGVSLLTQLRASPILSQRRTILFSGGSVWAMTTMIKPESALNPFPTISLTDIQAYKNLIMENYPNYPKPDFSKIADKATRDAAEADYNKIVGIGGQAVFKQLELLAGAYLIDEVSKSFDFNNRNVMFDRKSMTAWITAKITPTEYRDLLPESLGRKVPTSPSSAPSTQLANQSNSAPPAPDSIMPPSKVIESVKPSGNLAMPSTAPSANIAPAIVNETPSVTYPGGELHAAPVMELVEVWENEVVYEMHPCSVWGGRLRGWRSVCQCVTVVRPVCRVEWRYVVPLNSPTTNCGCSSTVSNIWTNHASDGFRFWTNHVGTVSKFPMRLKVVSGENVVFESPSGNLIVYRASKLSQKDMTLVLSDKAKAVEPTVVTDVSGKFKANVSMVSMQDDEFVFLKSSGELIRVYADRLSKIDQSRFANVIALQDVQLTMLGRKSLE